MGKNLTPYETGHFLKEAANAPGFALGTVVSVDVDSRLCSVKTWGGDRNLDDMEDTLEAQWLMWDATREGDESGATPRRGAMVLIVFVSDMAYILGAIRPINEEGLPLYGNEAQIREGDKVLSTKALNKIAVRSNQVVEIVAKPGALQTIYQPKDNTLAHLAQNHQLIVSGGRSEWTTNNLLFSSKKREIVRRDSFQAMVLMEEKGFVDLMTVYKNSIGPVIPPINEVTLPIFQETIDIFGSREILIQPGIPGGIKINQDALGPLYSMKMGLLPQFSLDINGLLGMVDIDVNKLIQISLMGLDGSISIQNKIGSFNIMGTGDIALANKVGGFTMSPVGDFSMYNKVSEVSGTAAGDITIKNPLVETKIGVDGSLAIKNKAAYTIEASAAGEISIKNIAKGGLKISPAGMVALGGPTAELLDILDQFIDEVTAVVTGLTTETHMGNMGLPTLPDPSKKKPYIEGIAKITKIKAMLATIKGSL